MGIIIGTALINAPPPEMQLSVFPPEILLDAGRAASIQSGPFMRCILHEPARLG